MKRVAIAVCGTCHACVTVCHCDGMNDLGVYDDGISAEYSPSALADLAGRGLIVVERAGELPILRPAATLVLSRFSVALPLNPADFDRCVIACGNTG